MSLLRDIQRKIFQRVDEAIAEQYENVGKHVSKKDRRELKRKGVKKFFRNQHIKHFGTFSPVKPFRY